MRFLHRRRLCPENPAISSHLLTQTGPMMLPSMRGLVYP
jgi:hypothetical protein